MTPRNQPEEKTIAKNTYLKVTTVMARLDISERHVYDLIVSGELKAIKVGSRAVRISEQSLDDFVEKREINPEDLFDPDKEKKEDKESVSIPRSQQTIARPNWMVK